MLLTRRVRTVSGTYCRDCGLALGRSIGNLTLWTGWWGIISFFTNIGFVFGNAGALLKHGRLGPAYGSVGSLNPGRSLLLRSGTLFVVLLAVAGAGSSIANSNKNSDPGYGPGSGSSSATWAIGNCVTTIGVTARPVSCDAQHDGRIVDAVTTKSACPAAANMYVDYLGTVYCIEQP